MELSCCRYPVGIHGQHKNVAVYRNCGSCFLLCRIGTGNPHDSQEGNQARQALLWQDSDAFTGRSSWRAARLRQKYRQGNKSAQWKHESDNNTDKRNYHRPWQYARRTRKRRSYIFSRRCLYWWFCKAESFIRKNNALTQQDDERYQHSRRSGIERCGAGIICRRKSFGGCYKAGGFCGRTFRFACGSIRKGKPQCRKSRRCSQEFRTSRKAGWFGKWEDEYSAWSYAQDRRYFKADSKYHKSHRRYFVPDEYSCT